MADIDRLLGRIDAAFSESKTRIQSFQERQTEEYLGRQQRLEQFEALLVKLRDTWHPRLEALAKRFGEKVQVTPCVTPGRREAVFRFDSELAHIDLRFSVFTDTDVRRVICHYDLQILPILMHFDSHAEIEFPFEAVDIAALTRWIDDRIVSFVNTYLSLHENAMYLKGHLVQDPIAQVEFPKYAAGAVLEADGKQYYFVSDETCREFVRRRAGTAASSTSPK